MKTVLHGQLAHMAESEVLAMVNPDTLERIRRTDAHPRIRAYAIAHEGVAGSSVEGIGKVAVRYFQDAILAITRRVRAGTKIFHRHTDTNSHDGRQVIGEVVGKEVSQIDGKLHTVAAVYVDPRFEALPLDVASIEAEVEFTHEGGGNCTAVDVRDVTGIALSSSAVEKPGFPGATLLATVQAFVAQGEGKPDMTRDEMKAAVKEMGLSPSELFEAEVLTGDPVVVAHVHAKRQTEYEHAKRIERKLEEAQADWQKRESEMEKALSEAKATAVQSRTRGLLETLVTDRKLDDKQKAFVEKRFGTFKSEATDETGLKTDLQKHLDAELEQFREIASLLGVGPAPATDRRLPASDNTTQDADDLSDPVNNPFIPQPAKA